MNKSTHRAPVPTSQLFTEQFEDRRLFSTAVVAGEWKGVLTQPSNAIGVITFNYQLDLTQTGQSVTGTERISIPDQPQYYGIITVSGTVAGNTFSYKDGTITTNNPKPGTVWLIKTIVLQVSADDKTMAGTWDGNATQKVSLTHVPTIAVVPPAAQTATAGILKSFSLGSFSEIVATAAYSVDVKWGDGTADTVFTNAPGTIAAKSHAFAKAGTDTVTLVVTDAKGVKSNTATFKVTVNAAATTASIAGNVFKDLNANSILNSGEPGLTGVKVYLDGNKNGKLDSGEPVVTTDASGNYKLTNLVAGTYRVREVAPAGYKLIAPAAGYIDEILTTGKTFTGVNFANVVATASIAGMVFNDANVNQKLDPTELGLAGWQVYIDTNKDAKFDAGDVLATSDINGAWKFSNLTAGAYQVHVVQVAKTATTTPGTGLFSVSLAAGQAVTGEFFGQKRTA